MPTCLRALNYFVLRRSFFMYFRAYNHSQNILRLTSILALLFFSGLFDLSFHSKPQNKLLLLKLHTSILSRGVLLFQLVHVQKQ